MNKKTILKIIAVFIFITVLVCSFIWDFPKWINLITFGFTILSFIYHQSKDKDEDKKAEKFGEGYKKIIDRQNIDIDLGKEEVEKLEKERSEIESVLEEVNEKLNEENISKDELIKDLKDDLDVVLLIKHAEGEKDEPKPIKDALKKRGFKSINYGMYVLPPYLSPYFKNREELNKWIDKQFLKKISENHRYKMSVMIVNLKKILVREQGENHMKSVIEKLNFTDLVRLEKLNEFIRKKKDLSLMDIIQLPKLTRIIDKSSYGWHDHSIISEKEGKIIEEIKENLGKEDFKTKDFANINKDILINILEKNGIRNKDQIAEDIIKNSKFWGQF